MFGTYLLRTRKLKPTNTRGSRVLVTDVVTGRSRVMPWNFAADDAHDSAVLEYVHALGVRSHRRTIVRTTRNNRGYVFAIESGVFT